MEVKLVLKQPPYIRLVGIERAMTNQQQVITFALVNISFITGSDMLIYINESLFCH